MLCTSFLLMCYYLFQVILINCEVLECNIIRCLNDGAGYSIRHLHQGKVDQRLESIEKTVSIGCTILNTFICLFLVEVLY